MAEEGWKERFGTFFRRYYWDEILHLANEYPEQRSLTVNYYDIENFDQELADELIVNPDEIIPAAEEVLREGEELVLPVDKSLEEVHLRIINNPNKITIRNLRSKHLMQSVAVEGMIRKATEVRPKITNAAFYCMRCEHVTYIPQTSQKFTEPHECENETCGRKGPFKTLVDKSTFVDAQKLQIQESPENLRGGEQPQSLDIDVDDDLAGIVTPGDRVIINGVLRSHQRTLRDGKSPFYDLVLHANSIEYVNKEFEELEITPEDEEEILELSKDPQIYEKVAKSISPSIYGYENIKEALALQLFSGVTKALPDSSRVRGDIHILIVGDPGIAKSQMLRYMEKLAPRGVFTSGKSASSSGLTASAVRDELGDGRWTLEAGALVMADMGVAAVDELDKMSSEDKSSLHEAMEQQCYDDQTEILTENGWKFFKDVIEGERVASLTPDGKLEYVVPGMYVASDYEGDMYYLKSRQVDLAVTPNHNMYVDINKRANEWTGFDLHRMDSLPLHKRMRFKKNAYWDGERIETFEIPSIVKYVNQNCSGIETESITVKMNDWLEFLGYYLPEGSVKYMNGIPYSVQITQKTSGKIQKIQNSLDRLGFKWSYDGHSFSIHSKQLAKYLSMFGKCHEKFVPEYVKKLCPGQIKIFVDAMVLGDGYIRCETGQMAYITSSKRLADDMQELALKMGYSANNYVVVNKGEIIQVPEGRSSVISNDIYEVSFIREGGNHPSINTNGNYHIEKKPYKGKIYCVEVPNHVLYVRRNGKPVWCGNTVSVAKAGIIATLKSRCALLGAANPKYGRFDRYEGIATQINMPPALISRFDLIFVLLDVPDDDKDRRIANHILKAHYAGEMMEQRSNNPVSEVSQQQIDSQMDVISPPIDVEKLRKYVAYARRNVYPILEDDARNHLIEFYMNLRKMGEDKDAPVPVTARQLEALVRLTESSARVRLSSVATLEDAKRTTNLVYTCLKQVGVDPDTGAFDVDVIETGTSKSQRDKIKVIREIIQSLADEHSDKKGAPVEEVYSRAEEEQIDREHAEELVTRMRRQGDLLSPDKDHIRLV
ncbi:MCM family protein [Methanohalobium evestigatum Z-7303]|uniref:DNA helicase n=1 Tax=Methanohalobium evestigatum (strain ATCC BAA-1072 / DSM 3721 / NBRC 107634 / OCM 161 / Z-7303) TaxID=644295 RepID=D7E8A3_METEZ|nr:LAGLIDADG family homing endonuclease [Methanohalobium evestigatum]ADI73445.1 MCM family protein [Methanohalobium evestigatum Z-7303]